MRRLHAPRVRRLTPIVPNRAFSGFDDFDDGHGGAKSSKSRADKETRRQKMESDTLEMACLLAQHAVRFFLIRGSCTIEKLSLIKFSGY